MKGNIFHKTLSIFKASRIRKECYEDCKYEEAFFQYANMVYNKVYSEHSIQIPNHICNLFFYNRTISTSASFVYSADRAFVSVYFAVAILIGHCGCIHDKNDPDWTGLIRRPPIVGFATKQSPVNEHRMQNGHRIKIK